MRGLSTGAIFEQQVGDGCCGWAAGTAHDTTAAQEAEALRQAVDGALAQCLHVLYGVALPSRDPDWGGMEVLQSLHNLICIAVYQGP